jgi:hypothetical protein
LGGHSRIERRQDRRSISLHDDPSVGTERDLRGRILDPSFFQGL